MNFTNQQLELEKIPHFEEVQYESLDKSWRLIALIVTLIEISVFIIAFSGATLYFPSFGYYYHIAFFSLPFILVSFVYPFWAYNNMGVALREHDIAYKEGVVWRSESVLAFNRIQHIEVSRGPLERKWGLAELKLYSAGGMSADLTIEGLNHEQANNIRQFIQTYKKNYEHSI